MSASADQEKHPIIIPVADLKRMAAEVADELRAATQPVDGALRGRFIEVRTALFQRGIYDPVLGRFDSATVPVAPPAEVAEQLSAIAAAF